MRPSKPLLAVLLCIAPALASAQTPPAESAPERSAQTKPATGLRSEPAVERNVIEDAGSRIEELKVRGAVRSTVVKPKGAISAEYEVIPADAGRDIIAGPNSAKGAAGQRVWRVLSF